VEPENSGHQQPEASTVPSVSAEEDEMRLELEGTALLQLWHRWKGDIAPLPPTSLTGGRTDKTLPLMGDQAVSREKLRLRAQLEADAKSRVQELEKLERDKGESSEEERQVDLGAACYVYLSRYKMVAWVFLFPPVGQGEGLQIDRIGEQLQASGVTSGVDSAAILHLVQEERYFQLIPIAWGTAATEGKDGNIVEHYPREVNREIKVDEKGIADYRSTNYVQVIHKGAVICDIEPPQEGQPGLRVTGEIIEPKKVKPAKPPAGSNTTVSEDGTQLVATLDGHLQFSNGAFMIRPLLDIPGDVDYSTGNIDYRGDVHIHGDIRENFFVRATGNVTVDGTVEAANIEAGGDLLVSSGILGDNRAIIKSGGCIRVKYLESCVAYAGKAVYADCVMTAHVFSDDVISVTTGRGTIIGGSLTAGRMIQAQMIGSQAGMKTSLVLGELPYTQEKLQNDENSLRNVRQELQELTGEIEKLEEQQGLEGMGDKLAKARLRRSVLSMKENQLVKRQEAPPPENPDLGKCRLECETIYPVTSLKIGEDTWRVDEVRNHCKIGYDMETCSIKDVQV
jgi:hypothetical protein